MCNQYKILRGYKMSIRLVHKNVILVLLQQLKLNLSSSVSK